MIREQLSLWEDPKQIILNKEKVDIATLRSDEFRKNSFDLMSKGIYFIYKTGGINPFMKEKGPIFPFIKNDVTGKIIKLVPLQNKKDSAYPYTFVTSNKFCFKLNMHKIVALAFLPNNNPEQKNVVDHLDGNHFNYLPENLEWVSSSENSKRRKSL